MKTAMITGVTGQGGCYLSELLLEKGYSVIGTTRDLASANLSGLEYLGLKEKIKLVPLDVKDNHKVFDLVEKWHPDEIYNFASPSSVAISFTEPHETTSSIVNGSLNILEAIHKIDKNIRYLESSSSEMFGDCERTANESTPFNPYSPYGVAKTASYFQTRNYRESFDLHASAAIFFNFESPLRPLTFVTRKIVQGAIDIAHGNADKIHLGNLDIVRDWGWAADHMDAAWRILQQENPDDFVIATGRPNSLRNLTETAFELVGLDYLDYIVLDNSFLRPHEIGHSYANPEKAEELLNWTSTMDFSEILEGLLDAGEASIQKSPTNAIENLMQPH